ncbi:hypothetical protein BV25DRAFT_1412724 [Artomyces pyxidatus]|uniref:Uncharacterized protein n=1 Tax=Artomyces pyxidatus TaxID=48021 RepID=A0ACB8TDZ1_9AGAM|nr:hypothetical protein BV25DRAFT_1412724 [Artomyces pyxidatus]
MPTRDQYYAETGNAIPRGATGFSNQHQYRVCHPNILTNYTPLQPPPIGRLPVEVLSEIFSYLPHMPAPGSQDSHVNQTPPKWAAVTQVCHHWRHVAYSSKEFWRVLPLASRAWTQTALQRSQPRPVVVRAPSHVEWRSVRRADSSLEMALQHVSRIQELWLEDSEHSSGGSGVGAPLNALMAFEHLAVNAAPCLEILFAENSECSGVPIPSVLFNGQYPAALRALYLKGFSLPPTSVLLRSPLTTLELESCASMWATYEHMARILAQMPNLETLKLKMVLPEASDNVAPRVEHVVQFPRTQSVCLQGNPRQIYKAMHCISFPPQAMLELSCVPDGRHISQSTGLIKAVLRYHYSSFINNRVSFKNLHIMEDLGMPGSVELKARHADPSGSLILLIHPSPEGGQPYEFGEAAVEIVSNVPLFHELYYLNVSHHAFASSTPWFAMNRCAPRLRGVFVHGIAIHGILDAMAVQAKSLFAKLDYMGCDKVDFKHRREDRRDVFSHLMECAETRRSLRRGPHEIDMTLGCNISSGMMEDLEEFFENGPIVDRPPSRHWDNYRSKFASAR